MTGSKPLITKMCFLKQCFHFDQTLIHIKYLGDGSIIEMGELEKIYLIQTRKDLKTFIFGLCVLQIVIA